MKPKALKQPAGKVMALVGLLLFLALLPLVIKSQYQFHVFNLTLIYIMAASSLRTIALSGQVSIGHAAFMGLGAYLSGILALELGISPWISIPLAALATMGAGFLFGIPLTRVRSVYFSMVSLFAGMAIVALIGVFEGFTGGDAGLVGIPPLPSIPLPGGGEIAFFSSKTNIYYLLLLVTAASLLVLYRIEHCRIGVSFKAIDQSYMVASSVGINETRQRILAITVGCFFAGLAGAFYAHYNMNLTRSTFDFMSSINLLIYVLVGGLGSFAGPVVGAAVLIVVPEYLRFLKEYTPFIFGGIMLVVAFLMPQGIAGLAGDLWRRLAASRGEAGEGGHDS
jgi:branched-chain amino acid transport system permease protein